MNLYLAVLKAFLNQEVWSKYHETFDISSLKADSPELYRLFLALSDFSRTKESGVVSSVADLEVAFGISYPNAKREEYTPLFKKLEEIEVDLSKVSEYLEVIRKRSLATRLATCALAIAEGTKGIDSLPSTLAEFQQELDFSPSDEVSPFVTMSLENLEHETYTQSGLRWRLPSLNRNLGSLRKGDFGFVFARPETGKTTFLASEITYMAEQANGMVLWINNEEQGSKVLLRSIQGSFGVTLPVLFANKETYQTRYQDGPGKNLRILDEVSISKSRIEELCKAYNPCLIIIDQIDKIKGFSDDRLDIELKEIYTWARELAKTYGPVIGICQAGSSGDGKRFLTMNDVDNSKTGKQGEADFILAIGKVYDDGLENVRYLHLCKNKLLGDVDANPSMRHGKWEVKIKPDVARYEDFD